MEKWKYLECSTEMMEKKKKEKEKITVNDIYKTDSFTFRTFIEINYTTKNAQHRQPNTNTAAV